MFANCWCGKNNYQVEVNCRADREKFNQDFQVIRCQVCGLARNWPKPAASGLPVEFYQTQDDYLERKRLLNLWFKFSRILIRLLRSFKIKGEILEVGCNLGVFVEAMRRAGYNARGIDLSAAAISEGRKIFNLTTELKSGDLGSFNFKNSFSALVYWHVLEHIADLNEELGRARRALRAQGILIIAAPNYNSLWRRILRCRWYAYSPEQHVWEFDRQSLTKILETNDFKVDRIIARRSLYHQIRPTAAGIIKIWLYILAYLFGQGDNLIIVAQKNNFLPNK